MLRSGNAPWLDRRKEAPQNTVADDANKEAAVLSITIAPGSSSGRHTHPGDCYGTVVEGTAGLRIDGREPRRDKGKPRMQPVRAD
jgi:quercetin dioxygenase-like cupin family protein